MSQPLLTPKQLTAVQAVALRGMQTPITILRRAQVAASGPGSDYGDDELTYTETSESRRTEVMGWFRSTPTPVQTVDTGAIITVNTYRLLVPVGTDILPGDEAQVDGDPNTYTVSDTTAESNWLPYLQCSLRKRE